MSAVANSKRCRARSEDMLRDTNRRKVCGCEETLLSFIHKHGSSDIVEIFTLLLKGIHSTFAQGSSRFGRLKSPLRNSESGPKATQCLSESTSPT